MSYRWSQHAAGVAAPGAKRQGAACPERACNPPHGKRGQPTVGADAGGSGWAVIATGTACRSRGLRPRRYAPGPRSCERASHALEPPSAPLPHLSGVSPYAVGHPLGKRIGAGLARLAGGDRVAARSGQPGAGLLGSAWSMAYGSGATSPVSERPAGGKERDYPRRTRLREQRSKP